jgi:hypothetical protein
VPALRQVVACQKNMGRFSPAIILRIKMITKTLGIWLIPIFPTQGVESVFIRCLD